MFGSIQYFACADVRIRPPAKSSNDVYGNDTKYHSGFIQFHNRNFYTKVYLICIRLEIPNRSAVSDVFFYIEPKSHYQINNDR